MTERDRFVLTNGRSPKVLAIRCMVTPAWYHRYDCFLVDGGTQAEERVPSLIPPISGVPGLPPETPDWKGCWKYRLEVLEMKRVPSLILCKDGTHPLGHLCHPGSLAVAFSFSTYPYRVGTSKASGHHSINSLSTGGLADNNLKN